MNQSDQNINKDMSDPDLIDVEKLDFLDDQTWLYKHPDDSGENVDLVDWSVSLDWPAYEDEEYLQVEKQLYAALDEYLKNQVLAMPDKHKFDSRTYVKPKKQLKRPSIHNFVEASSPPSLTTNPANKYLTYNKYNAPLGPILRLKTFNVDTNSENSTAVKEYAMKRRSVVQDDDPQLEDAADTTITFEGSERLSPPQPSKPIKIDLSQPANNLHNTFNKGFMMHDRGSLNMYQSGESLMRMSPPSLVSSLLMDNSGNFNSEMDKKTITSQRDSGVPLSGRDSIDPMMTSMTLSILDEKDMSTSFLSQTTYPDNDSLIDSLPPSLVNSVNSSYVISNTTKPRDSVDSNNLFSSATYTRLEQSEKLLSARPRAQMFNSFTKRDSLRNSESYTKSKEEPSNNDTTKVLNENLDKKESPKAKPDMTETITLHYSNKFKRNVDAEKENLNSTFEKDDAFYKDMGMQRTVELGKHSLNVTLDKKELNEIIQARQKLSLARKALPEPEKLPNQVDISPPRPSMDETITVPKSSMENASELLARRRAFANGYNNKSEDVPVVRDPPKRNATFKKTPPTAPGSIDTTVVYVNAEENKIIDINSATMTLLDPNENTLQKEDWGSHCAMVGSSESTDTGTLSSSSPPDSVPDHAHMDPRAQVASTPLMSLRKGAQDLLNLQSTISPIYDTIDDKSYTVNRSASDHNATVINSATIVRKTSAKRDILVPKGSPERKIMGPSESQSKVFGRMSAVAPNVMAPPSGLPMKSGLPTSKLRQYSSHKELRIPTAAGASSAIPRIPTNRTNMVRRGVYASNPALSPTAPAPPITTHQREEDKPSRPVLTNPPALIRQGTETLRRERPQSQLVQPKDPPPPARPYSIAGASQLRAPRPSSVPAQRPQAQQEMRPASSAESRGSALRRPSRLPPPRRPPSVYSVAPASNVDHY